MKFQTGDLVLVEKCEYKQYLRHRGRLHPRLLHRSHLRFLLLPHLHYHHHLKNTYGVITQAINHRDAWEGQSTKDHNVYFWYSQVDAKTYWFCEDELIQCEVMK